MRSDFYLNPARGQLKQDEVFFYPSSFAPKILSRKTGSAVPSRVSPLILYTQAESDWLAVPSRVSPLILYTRAESDWLVLTRGIPPTFRDGFHLYTVNRHRVSPY